MLEYVSLFSPLHQTFKEKFVLNFYIIIIVCIEHSFYRHLFKLFHLITFCHLVFQEKCKSLLYIKYASKESFYCIFIATKCTCVVILTTAYYVYMCILCLYRVPYVSHLFEIQTASRTFLCGASTHEEMQSWVGILQTLTQYYGQQETAGVFPSKALEEEVSDKENGESLCLFFYGVYSHA